MITESEQEFFKAFSIAPRERRVLKSFGFPAPEIGVVVEYPEITAEKLLQLLCIVIDEYNSNGHTFYLDSTNVKELKEEILDALTGCIDASCDLFESEVKQIQQLFKIERNDK